MLAIAFALSVMLPTPQARAVSEPAMPTYTTVFGARVGKDGPEVLEKQFGRGSRVVRHYWDERSKQYVRDDGWNWWRWDEANADVQSYWDPASPVAARRITSIWIVTREPKLGTGQRSIRPKPAVVGWLKGIRMGMKRAECLATLKSLFGRPTSEFGQYVWRSGGGELAVTFERGRLCDLRVSVVN